MKHHLLYSLLLASLLACTACDKLSNKESESDQAANNDRFYVLCEGLFNLNNGTLAYWDGKQLEDCRFRNANGRGLGDTPNDIQAYGGKLYLVVNVSSQIEVVDLQSGCSIKQIPLFLENDRPRQPRYICFHQDKAYITCFDGSVARLDTATLEIDANLAVGRHPEGLAVANGKLYVANSGGLDNPNYDRTLSVIDLDSFTETKRIEVAMNPYKVHSDSHGNIYVNSRGNYQDEDYCLQKIDTQADTLVKTYPNLKVLNFTVSGDIAYLYDFNFGSKQGDIFVFDLAGDSLLRERFICDNTKVETPYGLSVNPKNGDVFVCEAYNYVSQGDVLCFQADGHLRYRISDVGLNPNTVVVW